MNEKSRENLVTPELIAKARSANTKLIQAIGRAFSYDWSEAEDLHRASGETLEQSEFEGIWPLYHEAAKWLHRTLGDRDASQVVTILRNMLPLFMAAEQIDEDTIYVMTIVGAAPALTAVKDLLWHALLDRYVPEEDSDVGSWGHEFWQAYIAALAVSVEFFNDEPPGVF